MPTDCKSTRRFETRGADMRARSGDGGAGRSRLGVIDLTMRTTMTGNVYRTD